MFVKSAKETVGFLNPIQRTILQLGGKVWRQWDELRHEAAVIGTLLIFSVRPRNWERSFRNSLTRQVLAVAIEPLGFVSILAVFVGISVVVQLTFWVGETGQAQLLGPLLVTVVARELGPVLINLVVIVRSGSAMTTELGSLKINGCVRNTETQGGDPLHNLVMPRVLGMAVSTFCLTIVFIFVALASGYLFASRIGQANRDLLLFADTVSSAIQPRDVIAIFSKSILPALFASATSCIAGLGVSGSAAAIPHATQRALTRSIAGLLVISVVISFLTYL